MKDTNFALLCKWLWCFHSEPCALWRKVITAKYEATFAGEIPSKSKYNSSRTPWSYITKRLNWFERNYKLKVNNGGNLSFWYANWTNRGPLYKAFLRMFALATDKNATIKDGWDDTHKTWTLNHRRPLNERETNTWNCEDLDHLFLNYKVTNSLCNKLFSYAGDIVDRSSIQAIGTSLCSFKLTSEENVIKLSGGTTILWSVWKEINS
ncbi:LINE-1 retrotransposable element ORF2 protein [Cucumis melo var. makuwa]|uniref:LINE-1 retrotransposable element ORF2 protein n=1 Tax=Cucumis melo var. makuwa TaxID=1194695 RepID=A0A5D3D793_CUCMM|nr:LINE-1 retrotransposable element ORF2 protein [Cucumis melo var. makuwa]